MGVSSFVLELKLWHLMFWHLMTFLVTLTCDSTLLLRILAFLGQFEYIFTTTISKRSILIRFEALMSCIESNGHAPDEYQPDDNKKNWFHPGLTIPIWIPPAKLQNSGFSTSREIYRKPLHIISKPTVGLSLKMCGARESLFGVVSRVFLLEGKGKLFFTDSSNGFLFWGSPYSCFFRGVSPF